MRTSPAPARHPPPRCAARWTAQWRATRPRRSRSPPARSRAYAVPATPGPLAPGPRPSFVDQLEEELRGARIARLREPEDRLLAQLGILVGLRDVEQLVDRRALVALRVDEDELLADLAVVHALVERRQVRDRRVVVLAGPEERLLPQLDVLLLVERDAPDPLGVSVAVLLREGEDDLLLQPLVPELRVERLEEGRVLGRVVLAEPEDRLLAQLGRLALAPRVLAEDAAAPRAAVLRQREDGLVLDPLVARALEDVLEHRD